MKTRIHRDVATARRPGRPIPAAMGTAGWAQAEADRARIRTVLRAPPDWRAPATTSVPASTTKHGAAGAPIAPADIVRTGGHQRAERYPPGRTCGAERATPAPVLHLPGPIQRKLKVGAVNDPLEHEADRVADQVMRMPAPEVAATSAPLQISRKAGGASLVLAVSPPGDALEREAEQVMRMPEPNAAQTPSPDPSIQTTVHRPVATTGQPRVQRKCAACGADEDRCTCAQRKADLSPAIAAPSAAPIHMAALRSRGSPLPARDREFFEPRFGVDFSQVRIHIDEQAAALARSYEAQAFTVGGHIVFAAGRYEPTSTPGRTLLAHELAHVVQQSGSSGSVLQRVPSKDPPLDPGQATLARIHRLLSRGWTDWYVFASEAREALRLLLALDPVTRLDVVMKMRLSGDWNKLLKHLSDSDIDSLIELQRSVDPNLGPLTAGDTVEIQLMRIDREATRPSKYVVQRDGVRLPALPAPVPVVGLTAEAAAAAIAEAYVVNAMSDFSALSLHVVGRGRAYSGQTLGNPQTVYSAIEARSPADKAHRRLAEFKSYLAHEVQTTKVPYDVIAAYWQELELNPEQYAHPSDLLAWARTHATERRHAAKETPDRAWIDLLKLEQAAADRATGARKALLVDAIRRYLQFFDNHVKRGDLDKDTPGKAWGRAEAAATIVETRKEVKDAVAAAAERRRIARAEHFTKVHADVLDAMVNEMLKLSIPTPKVIWATRPAAGGIAYQSSPIEARLRRQIADQLIADLESRSDDPGLEQIDAVSYITDWFIEHPLEHQQLLLAIRNPTVRRVGGGGGGGETEDDRPWWQTAVEVAVSFIPIVGQIVAGYEVVVGRDLFWNELSDADRAILGASILLPAASKVYKAGKGALTAERLAREYGFVQAEASAAYRALAPLSPGSRGFTVLHDAEVELRARRALDPARRAEAEKLLEQMGMTDAKTADALRSGARSGAQADARVTQAIERDINSLGPMTEETKAMLRSDAPLRQALAESPLASNVLKKCASECFPKMSAEQVKRVESQLERLRKTGSFNEARLREYLYSKRDDIDNAILEIAGSKTSAQLDARVEFYLKGKSVKTIAPAEARTAHYDRAYKIGETRGREYAINTDKLTPVDFDNPFGAGRPWSKGGRYGKGIDDVLAKGDELYIVEYKGAGSRPGDVQMTTTWVRDKILELYNDDGPEGKHWARKLAQAWQDGKLRGVVYKTPVEVGQAGETYVFSRPEFGRQNVPLPKE